METNFASAPPKDPVTVSQVEATVQRRRGSAVEKSVCCIIYVFRPALEWSSWGCSSSMDQLLLALGCSKIHTASKWVEKNNFLFQGPWKPEEVSGTSRSEAAEQTTTSVHLGSGRCTLLHRGWPMTLSHYTGKLNRLMETSASWQVLLSQDIFLILWAVKKKEKKKDTTHSE